MYLVWWYGKNKKVESKYFRFIITFQQTFFFTNFLIQDVEIRIFCGKAIFREPYLFQQMNGLRRL
jgi:hypothetical protein